MWTASGERFSSAINRAQQNTGGKVALGCGTAALVGVALLGSVVLLAPDGSGDAPKRDEPADYVSFETDTARTEHFEFTYPVSLRERAQGLVGRSEKLYTALVEVSGVDEAPNVVVDLTDEGGDHLGIAAWTKVRVALAQHPDANKLDRTFVHELAHVLQHHQSDRRSGDESEAVGFFAEGSAEFLALEVTGRISEASPTSR